MSCDAPMPLGMLLSARTRNALVSELSDLLFQLGAAAGLCVGFWWAFQRPAPTPPASCGSATSEIGECLSGGLIANVLPYAVGMGVGALAGAVLGVILGRLLLARRPRQAHRADGAGRWITARFPGSCVSCRAPIAPGDRISHAPGRALCATCVVDPR